MKYRRLAVVVGVVSLVWAFVWFVRFWLYTHPSSTSVRVDMPDYFTEIPAEWSTDISTDPHLKSERMMTVHAKIWNESRGEFLQWNLSITEEVRGATVESLIARIQSDPEDKVKPNKIELQPGVVASTWTQWLVFTELGVETRWYVFKMPNGRVYSATHWLAPDFADRRRLDYQFRRILASLRVKNG